MPLIGIEGLSNSGLIVGSGESFSASIRVWLDGADIASVTLGSGTDVVSVQSRGTLPLTLTSDGTTPVTYTSNGFNFTSTSWLGVASRLGLSVNPAFAVVAVASASTESGQPPDRRIVNLGRGANSTLGSISVVFSPTDFAWRYDNGNNIFAPNAAASNMSILGASRSEGSTYSQSTYRFNGETLAPISSASPSVSPTSTLEDFRIGHSGLWSGRILGLMILASGDLSTIEKAEGFLAHRYGQSSLLPANHPWKNSPPTL